MLWSLNELQESIVQSFLVYRNVRKQFSSELKYYSAPRISLFAVKAGFVPGLFSAIIIADF